MAYILTARFVQVKVNLNQTTVANEKSRYLQVFFGTQSAESSAVPE